MKSTGISLPQTQNCVYYPMPLSDQQGFRNAYQEERVQMTVAAQVSRCIVALPFYPELRRDTLAHVASTINNFYGDGSDDRR